MSCYAEMLSPANLARAWRWVKSNPDRTYKHYCRALYENYAIAEEPLLAGLTDRLQRRLYEPTHAVKLYFPKASGILRPYSILSVEDQIVYQAAVNVIAEHMFPKVRHRYLKEVFGHLYAGRTSAWFYRKWSAGYRHFNDACRQAFADGYRFTASFDLTACYDSLDHGVLRHALTDIGCDHEFTEVIVAWLRHWTATDRKYYMSHGIPQGPLSSGLLSEVVLREFDDRRAAERRVKYLRYVDDIRLFAKSERHLRSMLIKLDLLSKDIGLFPQASKIDIHEVTDIERELKSVSNPPESAVRSKRVNQVRLRSRLVKLTPRFEISNPTRFRYLLAHASPHSTITARLMRIMEKHPDSYLPICRYLRKYKRLPGVPSRWLVDRIRTDQLYYSVTAALIETAQGRLPEMYAKKVDRIAKELWRPRTMHAELAVVVGRWCIDRGLLTPSQITYAMTQIPSWWSKARLIAALSPQTAGANLRRHVANKVLRSPHGDVAIAGAIIVTQQSLEIDKPQRTINPDAASTLKEFGLIRRSPRPCGVKKSLEHMGSTSTATNWQRLFGTSYRRAERQIVRCRGFMDTNVTAWVNAFDVFNDLLLAAIYKRDPALGTYTLGQIGSVLGSTRLRSSYPSVLQFIRSIHDKRLESDLSHARVKSTGRWTGAIKFGYSRTARRLLKAAIVEIENSLP